LRHALLQRRADFAAGASAAAAQRALGEHLAGLLDRLEPDCLGLYWPVRAEFNAPAAILADTALADLPLALPFARRTPHEMHYRAWNRQPPTTLDECGIPACEGPAAAPDVVLVPCVGFTAQGLRLGYGGGYFDRWFAAHPHVTTVGVAWAQCEIDRADFAAEPHDLPLTLIVTERGVVG
jgi:5,10-methenyltetrahydrofolate synthetase